MTTQPNIPGIITADNTIECSGSELHHVIEQIETAGYVVSRMAVDGSHYTLTIQPNGTKEDNHAD